MVTRVLVVDDDPSIRQALVQALDTTADVHVADSAEQALALLGAASPDVILSDVRMPGLAGSSCSGLCVSGRRRSTW